MNPKTQNDSTSFNEERLLKLSEAAERLAISVRKLYRLIAEGQLPQPVKIGRCSRMPWSYLFRYLEQLKLGTRA